MTWLVTGGAGYIGAHVVRALRDDGLDVVVLDDLSTGDASRIGDTPLVRASLLDRDAVQHALADHEVSGVVHIAAQEAGRRERRGPAATTTGRTSRAC